MTRRDFQLIAATLKSARAWCDDDHHDADTLTHALADALAGTNPKFDRARFLSASGVHDKGDQ